MIRDCKIIVGMPMTNVVKNRYFPVTLASINTFSSVDFIDKILIADGQSVDDTVELHKHVKKVEFITAPAWDTSCVNDVNFVNQMNTIIKHVTSLKENAFLILLTSDVILNDLNVIEIKAAIKQMITENSDYMHMKFSKVVCKDVREKNRHLHPVFSFAIIKFTPATSWSGISLDELELYGNKNPQLSQFSLRTPLLVYEGWFFTREQIQWKIESHFGWNKLWSVEDAIKVQLTGKLKRHGATHMTYEDHPVEARKLVDMLDETHLAHSLFDSITRK